MGFFSRLFGRESAQDNEVGDFYTADIVVGGKILCINRPFFPAEWSREKVAKKIYEAYENCMKSGQLPKKSTDGKYVLSGFIKEGVEIEMVITQEGTIVTAYPYFYE